MIKTGIAIAVIIVLIICFYMFEPLFVWSFDWQTLPEIDSKASEVSFDDSDYQQEISKSREILTKAHLSFQAPAISIAAGSGNKILWTEARGYSDLEKNIAAHTETQFRIGSISKAVTSVGLGILLELEKMNLDDSVGRYVPYFANPEITIRQLASHTSGLRNYGSCFCFPIWEHYSQSRHHTIEESVAVFNGDALLFNPGTSFSYSTYNYTLLSAAIEKASGKRFLNFMTDEVFKPLKMNHTSGDVADSLMENRAMFYEVMDGEYKEAFPVDNSNKWAGGGLLSTPTDLVKLGIALLNHSILNQETITTLFAPQLLEDGTMNPQHYALGWRHDTFKMFEDRKDVQVIHHGGTASGATSLIILIPEFQLTVAMMINKQAESGQLFEYIIPIAESFILRQEHPPIYPVQVPGFD